jgi:hypothetical protein
VDLLLPRLTLSTSKSCACAAASAPRTWYGSAARNASIGVK